MILDKHRFLFIRYILQKCSSLSNTHTESERKKTVAYNHGLFSSLFFGIPFPNWKISNNLWICYAFEIELKCLFCYCCCLWSFWRVEHWNWFFHRSVMPHMGYYVTHKCAANLLKKKCLLSCIVLCIYNHNGERWMVCYNNVAQHLLYSIAHK